MADASVNQDGRAGPIADHHLGVGSAKVDQWSGLRGAKECDQVLAGREYHIGLCRQMTDGLWIGIEGWANVECERSQNSMGCCSCKGIGGSL